MPTTTATVQIARDRGFADLVYTREHSDTTSVSLSYKTDSIPYGVDIYARVKYSAYPDPPAEKDSPRPVRHSRWSRIVKFHLEIPYQIIGVCLDESSSSKGTFYWIDEAGHRVTSFDFHSHPTFANIEMVTQDASRAPVTMTKFPLFYIRTATSGPSGTFAAGKKCWWVSNLPAPGFRPHAAFKRGSGDSVVSHNYIGTYAGHQESVNSGTVIGSKKGVEPLRNVDYSYYVQYCANRNHSPSAQDGWRMFDHHDRSMLCIMSLIAKASADVRTSWGNTTQAISRTGDSYARMVFQGTQSSPSVWVDDLWACWWNLMHGGKIESDTLYIGRPSSPTSWISGPHMNRNEGYIRDIATGGLSIGSDTHDWMEYFVPVSTTRSVSDGTYCSWVENDQDGRANPIMTSGARHVDCGEWGSSQGNDGCSIFSFNWESNNQKSDHFICRICKS